MIKEQGKGKEKAKEDKASKADGGDKNTDDYAATVKAKNIDAAQVI